VLGLSHVDAGNGWLIFGLPPAEVAVHPSKTSVAHELYLMTDDVVALAATLRKRGVYHTAPIDQRWGIIMHVTLPSGGKLAIYEPRHERPAAVAIPAAKKPASSSAKAPAPPPPPAAKSASNGAAAKTPPKAAPKAATPTPAPAKLAPQKAAPAKAPAQKAVTAKAAKVAPSKPEKANKKPQKRG
jgi:hypothetical protein